MSIFVELKGKQFGRLTVIEFLGKNKHRQSLWLCECSCGTTKSIAGYHLLAGKIISCGCHRASQNKTARLTHGERKIHSKEYCTWLNMKARCSNKQKEDYKYYGGRGIKVCERWMNSYENFLHDMGRAPSENLSIDRINNEGDYTPDNCRWATATQQANNKRNNTKYFYGNLCK